MKTCTDPRCVDLRLRMSVARVEIAAAREARDYAEAECERLLARIADLQRESEWMDCLMTDSLS